MCRLFKGRYLYYGTWAEYYIKTQNKTKAIESIDQAIELVQNDYEKKYFLKKKAKISDLDFSE
jgi:predicted RNA polymerase sigma factor